MVHVTLINATQDLPSYRRKRRINLVLAFVLCLAVVGGAVALIAR
jgi:hypothetical protein